MRVLETFILRVPVLNHRYCASPKRLRGLRGNSRYFYQTRHMNDFTKQATGCDRIFEGLLTTKRQVTSIVYMGPPVMIGHNRAFLQDFCYN